MCQYDARRIVQRQSAAITQRALFAARAWKLDNEPLVNVICSNCQKVCSQLENVFMHNSPEAFFRELVGRVGTKNHEGKSIFYEPTFCIPPLAVLGKHPGHDFEILWQLIPDPANPGVRRCAPMSQQVFMTQDGQTLQLPFRKDKRHGLGRVAYGLNFASWARTSRYHGIYVR
jgi:hypothetical protein